MTKINFNIYHNPRCSKSRKALEILNSKTKDFRIIKYLEDGIDINELKSILSLNKISEDEIIRTNESLYKELKLTKKGLSKDAIINYIYLCNFYINLKYPCSPLKSLLGPGKPAFVRSIEAKAAFALKPT